MVLQDPPLGPRPKDLERVQGSKTQGSNPKGKFKQNPNWKIFEGGLLEDRPRKTPSMGCCRKLQGFGHRVITIPNGSVAASSAVTSSNAQQSKLRLRSPQRASAAPTTRAPTTLKGVGIPPMLSVRVLSVRRCDCLATSPATASPLVLYCLPLGESVSEARSHQTCAATPPPAPSVPRETIKPGLFKCAVIFVSSLPGDFG